MDEECLRLGWDSTLMCHIYAETEQSSTAKYV